MGCATRVVISRRRSKSRCGSPLNLYAPCDVPIATARASTSVSAAKRTTVPERVEGLADTLPRKEPLALERERPVRPAGHRGEVLRVHLDQLVEQPAVTFHQITGEQGMTFGGCEPSQVSGVVAGAQLGQVRGQFRAEPQVDGRNL